MSVLLAFARKEIMEIIRTGKGVILILIFALFGIMNPAIAKLTPWMMETMADSLKDTGLAVTAVEVNAMTSWTQFYKNAPMAMIVFFLFFSGIFTREYQRGTLVLMVTKGLSRWKILAAKTGVMIVIWTICYWLMFGITYGYNAYFWDNSNVEYTVLSAGCLYFLGIWLILLSVLGASIFRTGGAVLGITGAGIFFSYLLSLVPAWSNYLPTYLLNAQTMLAGNPNPADFLPSAIVTAVLGVCFILASVAVFNRKAI